MEAKLKKITTQYHTFEDNQVLTKNQLNEFINYFEDQDRLTRISLNGVGVACGFVLNINSTKSKITITQGTGVTTDGDLIKLQKNSNQQPLKSIDLNQVEYSHFKLFEDSFADYSFFKKQVTVDSKKQKIPINLWEIFPEKGEETKPLGKFKNLDEMVVLLYLESYPKTADLCTAIDCDHQGIEQISRLRVLLVSIADAENITKSDPVFNTHNIAEKYSGLPEIKQMRVDLTGAGNLNSIKQSFLNAIPGQTLNKLKKGYKTIFEIFGQPSISDKIDQLFGFGNSEIPTPFDFQYRYDLLADLIDTYNEIKNILLTINVECNPNIASFPKHLFLGKLLEPDMYKTLRHRFYKSPLSKTEDFNRKKVFSLLARTNQIVTKYNVSNEVENIKITPSLKSAQLGCKAIPYYYNVNSGFLNFWSFEKFANLKQKYNLCYHTNNLVNEPEIRQPLLFDTKNYDFLRIEGHLGLSALESRDVINAEKNKYGLIFDCIVIELESNVQPFSDFVKKNPGLEHRAGVSKGGTFILVSKKDKMVADFCLPYKIAEKVEEQSCCSLMECTYPWISTLKYLNNLARSTKGTQSRNKAMPQNYVLQVVEYKINGQSLINNTTTLTIPLQQIFLRRMHAITEALNNRFNKGVVFDFNESQKRLVITRAKEDTFAIRLREVSMATNNPVYTYSNNGMFRNNQVFRPDAMRCRDLKKYNPLFYEKLQDKIAPVGKDDDYGTFDEKWEKWNLLKASLVNNADIRKYKLTRMITAVNQLPPEIQTELRTLKTDFQNLANADTQFMLDGDWVTGEWVNKTMLDHHRVNKKNTHDEIVLFVNLRKFLHSETGITKLSIYCPGLVYKTEFETVIEKYNKFADFYFGSPSGENAIQV